MQYLWETDSHLILSFNLEEAQNTLEESVFHIQGKEKNTTSIPIILNGVFLITDNN